MQSNAQEQARVDAAIRSEAESRAMKAVGARLQQDDSGFMRGSHRMVEGAVCAFIGVTMTTLALYNMALWIAR